MAHFSSSVFAIQNLLVLLSFSWISAYVFDEILDTIQITDSKLLHFKLSKSSQFLCVDKTGFPRPHHNRKAIPTNDTNYSCHIKPVQVV